MLTISGSVPSANAPAKSASLRRTGAAQTLFSGLCEVRWLIINHAVAKVTPTSAATEARKLSHARRHLEVRAAKLGNVAEARTRKIRTSPALSASSSPSDAGIDLVSWESLPTELESSMVQNSGQHDISTGVVENTVLDLEDIVSLPTTSTVRPTQSSPETLQRQSTNMARIGMFQPFPAGAGGTGQFVTGQQ